VKPDLDKLQRVIGDALEGVLLTNDSRIIEWQCSKVYAGVGESEGVDVEVVRIGDEL
jgi:Holliday junction resolvase RusA-like endonuclease